MWTEIGWNPAREKPGWEGIWKQKITNRASPRGKRGKQNTTELQTTHPWHVPDSMATLAL